MDGQFKVYRHNKGKDKMVDLMETNVHKYFGEIELEVLLLLVFFFKFWTFEICSPLYDYVNLYTDCRSRRPPSGSAVTPFYAAWH